MPHKTPEDHAVTLLRGLVSQIEPEVRQIAEIPTRILNLLKQPSLTLRCCAEILAYYTFPRMDVDFHTLKSALISGALKDSEVKKLISKLPDDKRHLFEPLLGVRSFNFFEISQMSSMPFDVFFQTFKSCATKTLPADLNKLYHRIPEDQRIPENQQKLGDIVAQTVLHKLLKSHGDDVDEEIKSLQHLLQNLPDWKPKK